MGEAMDLFSVGVPGVMGTITHRKQFFGVLIGYCVVLDDGMSAVRSNG
jgi:hypothetical protein